MENNVFIGFDEPRNRKSWENVIIRNGIELDWEYNLVMVGDIIKSNDRQYLVTKGGVWRRMT